MHPLPRVINFWPGTAPLMHSLETYLSELQKIRLAQAGVAETSYYTALANLLSDTGKALTPN